MKPERVEHRRLEGDRAPVKRRRPVEDLDGRGHRDEETQEREDQAGIDGLAADEHVMAPNQKADHGNGNAGKRHEMVAEDPLPREAGDDLADHAHSRQDHDVNGGVRVEPEHVLEEDRVAAELGIEDADAPEALHGH